MKREENFYAAAASSFTLYTFLSSLFSIIRGFYEDFFYCVFGVGRF